MGSLNYADRHHILNLRKEWDSRRESRHLRATPELVPLMDRESHNELHKNTPAVPLLGYHALVRTDNIFLPVEGNTLATMDALMLAIEQSTNHPKAHFIERQLSQLAIQAIDLQKPYIQKEVRYGKRTRIYST